MRKYWYIAKNSWQEYLTYRLNFALEVIGGVVLTVVTIWLWTEVAGDGGIGEYSSAELITYFIGMGIITSYFFLTGQGDEVNDDVNRGYLSSLLAKPISPLFNWFVRDQMRKLMTLGTGLIGFALVMAAYRDSLLPPPNSQSLLLFFLFVFGGGVLHFLLYTLFALGAFWSEQTWGERFLIRVLSELSAGMIIPLSLFPQWLYGLANALPLKFFAFVPMQVYLGKFSAAEITSSLLQLALWIGALTLGMIVLYRRGLKSYAGEGI